MSITFAVQLQFMIQRFIEELLTHRWKDKKIVLAVSGGVDSMVMAELFYQCGIIVVVAHFNYALRGQDSEQDQILVKNWSKEKNIPFYFQRFELRKDLEEEGGNLQQKARDFRYQWFEELRESLDFDGIATAHHEGDSIETLLINLFKGTGISGLHGILPVKDKVIRPMLDFSKQEILNYAIENKVPWRLDQSNDSNDYLRNKIRNQIIPMVAEVIPNVSKNLKANIQRFRETEILYRESVERYRKHLLEKRGKEWMIPILKLKNCRPLQTIVYEILRPFGFLPSQTIDVLRLLDAENGKRVESAQHLCIKDRGMLIISTKKEKDSTFIIMEAFFGKKTIQLEGFTLKMEFNEHAPPRLQERIKKSLEHEAFVHLQHVDFPLCLRPWRLGDYFYPLGLNKKKKISKFLIDKKIPMHQKDKIWILESKKRIIWVLGLRLDDRFKMKESGGAYLYLNISESAV